MGRQLALCCPNGHEYVSSNIRIRKQGEGKISRRCGICEDDRYQKRNLKDSCKPWIDRPKVKSYLKIRYGLTPQEKEAMWLLQYGCCAVCLAPISLEDCHIDHDHQCCLGTKTCGQCIRGLLCRTCNLVIGFAESDPEKLDGLKHMEEYIGQKGFFRTRL